MDLQFRSLRMARRSELAPVLNRGAVICACAILVPGELDALAAEAGPRSRKARRPFRASPESIRLAVTLQVRLPLSPRNVEDWRNACGIGISRETGLFRWKRFGSVFAAETLARH